MDDLQPKIMNYSGMFREQKTCDSLAGLITKEILSRDAHNSIYDKTTVLAMDWHIEISFTTPMGSNSQSTPFILDLYKKSNNNVHPPTTIYSPHTEYGQSVKISIGRSINSDLIASANYGFGKHYITGSFDPVGGSDARKPIEISYIGIGFDYCLRRNTRIIPMVGIEARGVKFLQKKDVVLYTHIPVENYHYKEIEKKYVTMVVSASSIMFPAYATNFYLQPSINLEATSKSIAPASSISKEFTVSLGYVFNRKNS